MADEQKLNGSPSINKEYYYYYNVCVIHKHHLVNKINVRHQNPFTAESVLLAD